MARAYLRRVVDDELDHLMTQLAAIALEGPKGVGKTATAARRAATDRRLDDPAQLALVRADPRRLAAGDPPVLIDEWQRLPSSWDVVRRAVDEDPSPGRFLLTGSATPASAPAHSGAGRIAMLRMRPMTLAERGVEAPTVSLAALLSGDRAGPCRFDTGRALGLHARDRRVRLPGHASADGTSAPSPARRLSPADRRALTEERAIRCDGRPRYGRG